MKVYKILSLDGYILNIQIGGLILSWHCCYVLLPLLRIFVVETLLKIVMERVSESFTEKELHLEGLFGNHV